MNTEIAQGIQDFVTFLQGQENKNNVNNPTLAHNFYVGVLNRSTRFARIVKAGQTQQFVYAFVELATGLIFKPAGWKAPTLNFPRGTVLNRASFTNAVVFGVYGIGGTRKEIILPKA